MTISRIGILAALITAFFPLLETHATVVADGSGDASAQATWLEVSLHPVLSNRSLTVDGDSGRLDYTAPMQPGLSLNASVYPFAIVLPRVGGLSPLGLHTAVTRHSLLTEVEVRSEGRIYLVDVPTRFASSGFGLHYDLRVHPSFTLTPSVGLHSLTWALGYNPRLQSSFYQSVDLGLKGRYVIDQRYGLSATLRIRPGVDTGATAQSFGESSSGFGLALGTALDYALPLGLFAVVDWHFQHYGLEYTIVRNGAVTARNNARDRFHTLSIGLGYRY